MLLSEIIKNWKKPLNFKSGDKIKKQKLIKILEAARWAPSAENQQVWNFLVIDNDKKLDLIKTSVREQDPRLSSTNHKIEKPILNSKFIFSTKNYDALSDKYKEFVTQFHDRDLNCIKTASCAILFLHSKKYLGNTFGMTDIGASILNTILICEELGLKARWIRNFNRELLEKEIEIPQKFYIDALLAIGKPNEINSEPEIDLKEISEFFGYNNFSKDYPSSEIETKENEIPQYNVPIRDAILDRRAIRSFKNKKIPKSIVYELLRAAMMVPLTINKPYLRFIVVDDKDLLKKIADNAKIVTKQKHVEEVPLIIVSAYDCTNNSPGFYAESDTGAVIQNQLLRAHSMGIGSCWIGAFSRKKIRDFLNVPEDWHIPTLAIFGYPNNYPKPTPRKELGRIAHYNTWDQKFKKRKRSFFPSYHFISIGIRKLRDTRIKSVLRDRKVGVIKNIIEFKEFSEDEI